jgi:predicted RND superfamily exporter protein
VNVDCSVMPLVAFLRDHRAASLSQVLDTIERFDRDHPADPSRLQLLPVAGAAGIEVVTNIELRRADRIMLPCVFAGVMALCLLRFRSWRATAVALVPLALTAVSCQALMVAMGIGVKVGTLPVIALGVGIGVDYALYLLSVQLAMQHLGLPVDRAFAIAVRFTGRVVALVGATLFAGVATWVFSPIKFQADMGVLLAFAFVVNMVGALVLIPALSHFLLAGGTSPRPAAA